VRLARCIAEDRWPLRRAAERFRSATPPLSNATTCHLGPPATGPPANPSAATNAPDRASWSTSGSRNSIPRRRQPQQMLVTVRSTGRPLKVIASPREEERQLMRGDQPLEPRVRSVRSRSQPAPAQLDRVLEVRKRPV